METDDGTDGSVDLTERYRHDAHALASVRFVERIDGETWGHYGLSVIRRGAFEASERSPIDRRGALCRFLTGAAPDGEPPLAPRSPVAGSDADRPSRTSSHFSYPGRSRPAVR